MSHLPSLSLLNIASLIGLFSLIIPVIIHLINRSRGKLVYIGNIELVKSTKRLRVTEIKLRQWLLLLLRLLIFIIITLMVAELINSTKRNMVDETHIYLSNNWAKTATKSDFKRISHQYPSAKIFLLSADFPEVTQNDFQNTSAAQINIYAAVTEMSQRPTQAKNTIVFARNSLEHYAEMKPLLPEHINWKIEPLEVFNSVAGNVKVQVYFDSSRMLDKEIIKIAFEQLNKQHFSIFKVQYTEIENFKVLADADWVFWLSDRLVVDSILKFVKQGGLLLVDQQGNKATRNKLVKLAQIDGVDIELLNSAIKPSIKINNNFNKTLWRDNSHQSLLDLTVKGKGKIFQFHSRFNPAWGNLVEKSEFPVILSKLLFSQNSKFDNKVISETEITRSSFHPHDIGKNDHENLHQWLILLVSLLWLLERWFAERRTEIND